MLPVRWKSNSCACIAEDIIRWWILPSVGLSRPTPQNGMQSTHWRKPGLILRKMLFWSFLTPGFYGPAIPLSCLDKQFPTMYDLRSVPTTQAMAWIRIGIFPTRSKSWWDGRTMIQKKQFGHGSFVKPLWQKDSTMKESTMLIFLV